MHKVTVHVVAAFTLNGSGGNLAGVVFDRVNDYAKQQLAKRLGFSETVFVEDGKFRYFTTNKEIEFCGHATLAALSLMEFDEVSIELRDFTIYAKNNPVMFSTDDGLFINEKLDKTLILESLGIDEFDLDSLGMDIVYTGLKDLFINVKDISILNPDYDLIRKISKNLNIVGYHVYSFDHGYDAVTRNFAPLYGIDEESATGSANSGLAYLLNVKKEKKEYYRFLQGTHLNSESEIIVYIKDKIYISGNSTLIESLEIEIGGSNNGFKDE